MARAREDPCAAARSGAVPRPRPRRPAARAPEQTAPARPAKVVQACARSSPRSLDGIRLADGLAAAFQLDLDAARVAKLLVDLQGLVRAVHLIAVDAPDDVTVLDTNLRIKAVR